MDLISILDPIQERIQLVEERMLEAGEGNHPDLSAALAHLVSSGGKRVRPAFTLMMGDVLGADPDRIITLAAAIEMLHTATLVHDDLIDGSLLRRGISTINSQWSPAATVLTGDFVFAQAAKLAADTDSVSVMRQFANALTIIVSGEITQLFTSKGLASRDNYYNRIYAKTASMFELATGASATLSPAGSEVFEPAKRFGYEIGMAFQIVDDILDFTGDQSSVGKPVANDLRMGLITLPAIYYLESQPDDPNMQAVMHGRGHDDAMVNELIEDIRASGAVKKAMDEAVEFVKRGVAALREFPPGAEYGGLIDLSHYIVQRDI